MNFRINIIIFFFLEIGFSLTNPSNSFRNFGSIRPLSIQRMENFLSSPFEMCQLSWNRGFLSRVERFSQTNSSEWGAPLTFFALSLSLPPLWSHWSPSRRFNHGISGIGSVTKLGEPCLLDRNPCADRFEVHVFRVKGPDRERRETDGRERFDGRATSRCPTRSILKLKFEKLSWEVLTPSILSIQSRLQKDLSPTMRRNGKSM